MTDGAGSGSSSRPVPYGGHVPRRLSYASVASGAAPQNFPPPARSNAYSFYSPSNPSGNSYTSHSPTDQRYPRRQPSQDQEFHSGSAGSWRKPYSLPSYSRQFAGLFESSPGGMSSSNFFVPTYLRHSRYMDKLEAAHKQRLRREKEAPSAPSSNPASLSTSASNATIHRMAPSHRGMTYDIIESNPPKETDHLTPLPSKWSESDKYPGLDVLNDGMDLKYSGSASKSDVEAASIRADNPMPPACGIFYFEVEIKQKSKDSAIAIGFSTAESSLERLPGWEPSSWGYHGDDGKIFSGDHAGRTYSTPFSTGDVIGCGVNFNTRQAFFTRNGQDLDVAFRDLNCQRLYPTVGVKKYSGVLVSVNFGRHPFVFDINGKVESEKDSIRAEISRARVSTLRPPLDEASLIQELVAQFLAHDGYVETAAAFAQEIKKEKQHLNNTLPHSTSDVPIQSDNDAVHRQHIRRAILIGNIDQALDLTHEHFPTVLENNPEIVFHLKCRKFVELLSSGFGSNSPELEAQKIVEPQQGQRRTSGIDDDFAHDMELDDQSATRTDSSGAKRNSIRSEPKLNAAQYLDEAMAYGRVLEREYREESTKYTKTLSDIFSLIAYANPKESVHGYLLDPEHRTSVAEELNSAILVSLGRSPSAALENVYKQTEALVEELSQEGGPAAFINLQADTKTVYTAS